VQGTQWAFFHQPSGAVLWAGRDLSWRVVRMEIISDKVGMEVVAQGREESKKRKSAWSELRKFVNVGGKRSK
jgi:hypothetical protein